jgi:hypothetical protein
MTQGQLAQLRELSKCYMARRRDWLISTGISFNEPEKLDEWEKAQLRRLTHQYRNQIAAMKRNRMAAR